MGANLNIVNFKNSKNVVVSANLKEKLAALDASQAVIEFELDGTIIYANENFLNAMGYTLDEVQGKHHSMFADPEFAKSAEYKAFWESLARGEFQAAQYRRLGKGGKEIWIEASYNPLIGRNGKPFRIVKFATDITARKMEEADLRGQIDAVHKSQAVIEFELDGTILVANENFLSVMGYTLDEVQGKHHSMFADPEFAKSVEYKAFWESLGRGEFQAAQYRRLGKGGKEIWIEASYNPICDANGALCKIVKFATDLTPRKEENRALANDFQANVLTTVEAALKSTQGMQQTANSLAAASEETSSQSDSVAAAATELSSAVNEISGQVANSTSVVQQAVQEAQKSERLVSGLVESVTKIGEVSSMISDIAEQTNLLALNATIEAARAGDAGKGFAVVAQEVKSLASETAKATEEISGQISEVQSVSQAAANGINDIIQVIEQINHMSVSISGAVEEQSACTSEVSSNISSVQAAATETGQSSAMVLETSGDMLKSLEELKGRVDDFLKKVATM